MIYQYTLDKILAGEKTTTWRLANLWDEAHYDWVQRPSAEKPDGIIGQIVYVLSPKNNIRWQVGRSYAIQPGRGVKAVGRHTILAIERRDARSMTPEEALADGFAAPLDFLQVWTAMHDKPLRFRRLNDDFDGTWQYPGGLADDLVMLNRLWERPAERYAAWKLTIKLDKARFP